MTLTVGSLFAGIGGIDLGLERAGMTVNWHSEIDPFACQILKKHWPHVPNLGDIKKIKWETVPYVDVIAGGYPCQPFSAFGKRQGENDERHLWPTFRDAISAIRPKYAFLENVRGHLSLGFDRVLGDLAEVGYDAEWQIISAASVGAAHQRERVICVAYPKSVSIHVRNCESNRKELEEERLQGQTRAESDDLPNNGSIYERDAGLCDEFEIYGRTAQYARQDSAVRSLHDYWKTEPQVGRVADGIPSRVDRLRGLGNAVVPQVAEYVGRLIIETHNRRCT
jgi:DNA (cytosine-5)-methyltransferase 1